MWQPWNNGIGLNYQQVTPEAIEFMKRWNFDTLRLAFKHGNLNLTTLKQVVDDLGEKGIHSILDLHNYNDLDGYLGSTNWFALWETISNIFKNNPYVKAYEIFNEPFKRTWHLSLKTKYDVQKAFASCTDTIRATGDNKTIVYCDPQFLLDTETLENYIALARGENMRGNVVFTFHVWANNQDTVNHHHKRIMWMKNTTNFVWMGELTPRLTLSRAQYINFTKQTVNLGLNNGIPFSLWMVGYPGGTNGAINICDQIMRESLHLPPTLPLPTSSYGDIGYIVVPIFLADLLEGLKKK